MVTGASDFLTRVNKLRIGDRTALKRAIGTPLHEAEAKALAAFYRCLPRETPKWQEDRWFAVACYRCLWDTEDAVYQAPLERCVSKMLEAGDFSESVGRRIEALLNLSWDEDGLMQTKLTRILRMIRQKTGRELNIDLEALLGDLIYWNSAKQSVQRKWAREIYAMIVEDDEE